MEQLKTCSKCKVNKSTLEFSKDSKSKDNLLCYCKLCDKQKVKQWRENNRDYFNKYQRERYTNDESFRLACNLRCRLRKALLRQVAQKNDKTEDLLGISFKEFKDYIEFLMTPDMTFNNIHLDHLRLLKSFDLTDPNQLKEAAHYKNIQPLLKIDNLKKGSKFHEHDLSVHREKVYEYQVFKYYSNLFNYT